MSKVTVFWEPHIFSHITNKDPPAYYFFGFLDLISGFLDFLDLKTGFFRPKKIFLDF